MRDKECACDLSPQSFLCDPHYYSNYCSGQNQEVPQPEREEDDAIAPGDDSLHPQRQQY